MKTIFYGYEACIYSRHIKIEEAVKEIAEHKVLRLRKDCMVLNKHQEHALQENMGLPTTFFGR